MNEATANEIRRLIGRRLTGALGTLHAGAPYVSMVPYAFQKNGAAFLIHVSQLAAHTNDMLVDPRVSLLITESETSDTPPQALPRLTIQALAKPIDSDTEAHAMAKKTYLGRFPSSAPIFQLGDFSLFLVTPIAARWIAGFGQAYTLTSEILVSIIKESP